MKLKAGFEPQDQDDKWRDWHTEERHNGNVLMHYTRAGTGNELYILDVKPNDGGSSTGAKIKATICAQNKDGILISEMQGKKDAIIVTSAVLDCNIEPLS